MKPVIASLTALAASFLVCQMAATAQQGYGYDQSNQAFQQQGYQQPAYQQSYQQENYQQQPTYFGNAQKSESVSSGTGSESSGQASQPPGSYLQDMSGSAGSPGSSGDSGSQWGAQQGSFDDGSSGSGGGGGMVKGAAGTIGKILGKGLGVAAPVAGAYAINKMMGNPGYMGSPYGTAYGQPYANPYGYGSVNPYGSPYGYNPYGYGSVSPYGNPYGYGMTSPYGYGASPYGSPYGYPVQQSMGSSLLNTGIRALFGGGSTGY